jgi:hypothetical protein
MRVPGSRQKRSGRTPREYGSYVQSREDPDGPSPVGTDNDQVANAWWLSIASLASRRGTVDLTLMIGWCASALASSCVPARIPPCTRSKSEMIPQTNASPEC